MTTNNGLSLNAPELEGAVWTKSSYSGDAQGQCVEVATLTAAPGLGKHGVRDSKTPAGPALIFPSGSFAHFMAGVKSGEFGI
ncbi:DUF397 domain-containing protein [Streptomyces sp. WAC04770]|nr:DUF397 domain-containing protein [Streptomyces sp. WAC04770]RST20455.1 DUF397 domain-containing protein [Streptomyces sp. WAC04770]